jgi:cytochrome c553
MRFSRAGLTLLGLIALFVATWGCGPHADTAQSGAPPQDGFRPGGGEPGGGSPIKQLMRKLDKGTYSLNAIANNLKTDPPAWDTIQSQTTEYSHAASDVGKSDPPKGSKESWAKLSAAFAASATALDKAAQAKDLAGARAVVTNLQGSCMACHQAHRGGPGGFGPPGGPGGPGGRQGGRPGGGPPGGG